MCKFYTHLLLCRNPDCQTVVGKRCRNRYCRSALDQRRLGRCSVGLQGEQICHREATECQSCKGKSKQAGQKSCQRSAKAVVVDTTKTTVMVPVSTTDPDVDGNLDLVLLQSCPEQENTAPKRNTKAKQSGGADSCLNMDLPKPKPKPKKKKTTNDADTSLGQDAPKREQKIAVTKRKRDCDVDSGVDLGKPEPEPTTKGVTQTTPALTKVSEVISESLSQELPEPTSKWTAINGQTTTKTKTTVDLALPEPEPKPKKARATKSKKKLSIYEYVIKLPLEAAEEEQFSPKKKPKRGRQPQVCDDDDETPRFVVSTPSPKRRSRSRSRSSEARDNTPDPNFYYGFV